LNRKAFHKVCEVALWMKEVIDELSLKAFIKTSGKTGLHIYVPIVRNLDYKSVRSTAETIGQFVLQRHQSDITMDWSVEKRRGKVFIDTTRMYAVKRWPWHIRHVPLLMLVYQLHFTGTNLAMSIPQTSLF
jgi:DNA primase